MDATAEFLGAVTFEMLVKHPWPHSEGMVQCKVRVERLDLRSSLLDLCLIVRPPRVIGIADRPRHRLCTINPAARDNLHPVQPWRFNCELPEVHPVRARSHVFCTRSAEAREHTLETIPNTREFGLTSGLGPSSYRAIPE